MQDPVARVAFGLLSMLRVERIQDLCSYAKLCLNVCRTAEWIHQNSGTSCASSSVWSCLPWPVNSMFANVCSYHLELHVSSCGCILDEICHSRQARHRLSQSFMARAGFEAKPLMIAQHSILAISYVHLWSFMCMFCTHGQRDPPWRAQQN